MINIAILAVVLGAVGLAARYVYKAKKAGNHCIGCPGCSGGGCCGGSCGSSHS